MGGLAAARCESNKSNPNTLEPIAGVFWSTDKLREVA